MQTSFGGGIRKWSPTTTIKMMVSLARHSFTQRRSWLRRAVWMGIPLTIILFVAAASSASARHTTRSVHRRALGTFKFIFSYNSQHISINDWLSLFTLCLAPLIAHLVAGVPKPGSLCQHLSLGFQPDTLSYPLPPSATLERPCVSL
jgi:Na+-transporting NADH:ubiquinone oxidoreductase subunit NqrB